MRSKIKRIICPVLALLLCLNFLYLSTGVRADAPVGYNYQYSDTVTREYFCYRLVMLMAASKNTTVDALYRQLTQSSRAGFLDSNAPYISIARIYGITTGYDEESFAPDDALMRQDAAVMLCALMKIIAPDHWDDSEDYYARLDETGGFLDGVDIRDYARNAAAYVVLNGIMTTSSGKNFDPKGNMDVEQAEQILLQFSSFANTPINPDKLPVNVLSGQGGITSENGCVYVDYGKDISIDIKALEGMCIDSVLVNGEPAPGFSEGADSWQLKLSNVTEAYDIVISYIPLYFTVTVEAGEGGSAEKKEAEVEYGGEFAADIKPDFGYRTGSVLVNGKEAALDGQRLVLESIHTDVVVQVSFKKGFMLSIVTSWISYAVLAVLAGLAVWLYTHLKKNRIADAGKSRSIEKQADGLEAALERHRMEQEQRMAVDAGLKAKPSSMSGGGRAGWKDSYNGSGATVSMFDGTAAQEPEEYKTIVLTEKGDEEKRYRAKLCGEVVIGRDPDKSQLVLGNKTVSGRHCLAAQRGGRVYISDAGSKNGTVIVRAGEKITVPAGKYVELLNGDELCLGTARLYAALEDDNVS